MLEAEAEARARWRANPDSFYFGGELEKGIIAAEDAAADFMGATRGSVALVENATVATMTFARRWERTSRIDGLGSKILCLGPVYKASLFALRYMFGKENVVVADKVGKEWAAGKSISKEEILADLETALREHQPRYLLLEHLSSQPALTFPVADMVKLARSHGCVDEVAVDAAHAAGQLDIDVETFGADFYSTNFHKWGFSSGPVAALHVRDDGIDEGMLYAHEGEEPAYHVGDGGSGGHSAPPLRATPHAIPSWRLGEGVVSEARWAGTRDYAPTVALKTALEYLAAWRSEDGLTVAEFNRAGYLSAASQLRRAWGIEDVDGRDSALDASGASMGMVRLPPQLDLTFDQPYVFASSFTFSSSISSSISPFFFMTTRSRIVQRHARGPTKPRSEEKTARAVWH